MVFHIRYLNVLPDGFTEVLAQGATIKLLGQAPYQQEVVIITEFLTGIVLFHGLSYSPRVRES